MSHTDTSTPRPSLRRDGPAAAETRWREWYEAHAPAVYGYVRFHVASADTAEDLTAETFLKAFRASEQYDPAKGGAGAWILAIARNTVRDHLRRARRRGAPDAPLRDLECDSPSPEEGLLWREQVGLVLEAVAELGRRDREIIGLRYGGGLETSAITEVLGLSETAVTTRLWRALRRLRRRLEA